MTSGQLHCFPVPGPENYDPQFLMYQCDAVFRHSRSHHAVESKKLIYRAAAAAAANKAPMAATNEPVTTAAPLPLTVSGPVELALADGRAEPEPATTVV